MDDENDSNRRRRTRPDQGIKTNFYWGFLRYRWAISRPSSVTHISMFEPLKVHWQSPIHGSSPLVNRMYFPDCDKWICVCVWSQLDKSILVVPEMMRTKLQPWSIWLTINLIYRNRMNTNVTHFNRESERTIYNQWHAMICRSSRISSEATVIAGMMITDRFNCQYAASRAHFSDGDFISAVKQVIVEFPKDRNG